ncbi:Rossmann-like domain-containing protein [candidate division KSB1 bacterium]
MNKIYDTSILQNSRVKLTEIIRKNGLYDVSVSVLVKTLTPKEAIGEPGRRDFPIITGKERVIEAQVLNARAHAFTDSPGEFVGRLREILDFPLSSNRWRAIYIATLNAVLKYLNLTDKTMHCKDDDPEKCAKEIASHLLKGWGKVKVGIIGLNPAIAEMLTNAFGKENVKITDLDKQNINSSKYGVEIWDGNEMTEELIKKSDVILITGTTLVNGTFDYINNCVQNYKKDYLIYGVTGAGICKLMGLNRICPYGGN